MRTEMQRTSPGFELDGGLAELRTDCASMARHWTWSGPEGAGADVPASRISGLAHIMVPPASAALLMGMSEYGD